MCVCVCVRSHEVSTGDERPWPIYIYIYVCSQPRCRLTLPEPRSLGAIVVWCSLPIPIQLAHTHCGPRSALVEYMTAWWWWRWWRSRNNGHSACSSFVLFYLFMIQRRRIGPKPNTLTEILLVAKLALYKFNRNDERTFIFCSLIRILVARHLYIDGNTWLSQIFEWLIVYKYMYM